MLRICADLKVNRANFTEALASSPNAPCKPIPRFASLALPNVKATRPTSRLVRL